MGAAKHRLFYLLQRAAHNVKKYSDRELIKSAGISTAQAAVLEFVARGDGVTQSAIAAKLRLNESAVTAMVARMTKSKLIVRKKSAEDVRAWCIRATPKGKQALSKAKVTFASINSAIDQSVGATAIAVMATQLTALAAAFDDNDLD